MVVIIFPDHLIHIKDYYAYYFEREKDARGNISPFFLRKHKKAVGLHIGKINSFTADHSHMNEAFLNHEIFFKNDDFECNLRQYYLRVHLMRNQNSSPNNK